MTYRPQWLSKGYEDLAAVLDKAAKRKRKLAYHFDIVVIGSGYGGAVAAARLASATEEGRPLSVCVLERGREYVPGAFPSSISEVPLHVRFSRFDEPAPKGRLDGLFDFRIGADVSALVGCGLGGGSLINAGVVEPPDPDLWLDPAWPRELRDEFGQRGGFAAYAARVRQELGAGKVDALKHYPKARAFKRFAQELQPFWRDPATGWQEADIAVTRQPGPNKQGLQQEACVGCGDCVTGCNFAAKNTLPMNYLYEAKRRGAQLFTDVTVTHLHAAGHEGRRVRPLWRVRVRRTSTQHPAPEPRLLELRARHVILSAGSYGSTEILMRSREHGLRVSPMLGKRFSSNGDMISVLYDAPGDEPVNGAPPESQPFRERGVGPTITGMVKCGTAREERVTLQELAAPGLLRRVFEEIVTTGGMLARLERCDPSSHAPSGDDPEAVNPARISNTLTFAAFGDDGSGGRFEMVPGWEHGAPDGAIRVDWKKAGAHQIYETQDQLLRRSESRGGLYVRNPIWKPVSSALSGLLSGPKPEGKLFCVHPLGGCPMGMDAETGVVDHIGRVYSSDEGTETHRGLLVLDGAIIPAALGINPLLTIAVLAERAVERYAALRGWQLDANRGNARNLPARFPTEEPKTPQPAATHLRFAEKMTGPLELSAFGPKLESVLEVEFGAIGSNPPLAEFLLTQPHQVRIARGTLSAGGGAPAPVSGDVYWMERGRTGFWGRVLRVFVTWGLTRALADYYQRKRSRTAPTMTQMWRDLPSLARLASNVGEVRYLRYEMTLDSDLCDAGGKVVLERGTKLRGLKTFKYAIGANPWRQLSNLEVSVAGHSAGILEIEPLHFLRRFAVQFQVIAQRDQPSALMDIASLAAFMARVVLKVHFWSFRAPEYEHYDPDREKLRLPGNLEGLERVCHGVRVNARETCEHLDLPLTHYRRRDPAPDKGPVLLFHGFGASGTQFCHPKQERNLVRHLAEQGRDVWVAELRTSIGVESSRREWTLDEIAKEDIPAIVERVCALSGRKELDVVAHCIGSAMFCTAVLAGTLQDKVRRAVLLQVGPLITLSKGNQFRGRLVTALRRYVLTDHVDSSIDDRADWVDVLIDRLLYTFPYPKADRWAHCLWPPCKPHTHIANCNRSAAVFGQLFPHGNVDEVMLDSLGELLGHTNLKTFEQTMLYAFLERLTDYDASNTYVTEDNVRRYFGFPVRFVHGKLNDVFHPDTTVRSAKLLRDVFGEAHPVDREEIPHYGHLDPLIGRNAEADVFAHISGFLAADLPGAAPGGAAAPQRYPSRPLVGPLLGWTRKVGNRWVARIWCRTDDEHNYAYFLIAVVLRADGEPVARHAFWAPLRGLDEREQGTIDLLGLIDVPLPPELGDYRIAIVSAHSSSDSGAVPKGAAGASAAPPLPADQRQVFYSRVLEAGDWATAEPLPEDYGKAVAQNRDAWRAMVRSAMDSPRTVDPGYDERPDSVWLPMSLLERLEKGRDALQFALASCRFAASRIDREQADAMFGRLRALLEPEPEQANPPAAPGPGAQKPALLLLAGDVIYADATAGMFDPKNRRERFYNSYREAWTAPHAREVLRRLPTYMMMDDHEIGDDWHPEDEDEDGMRQWGFQAFEEYALASSPRNGEQLCRDAGVVPDRRSYFYSFDAAGFPFFVCDTRTGRARRDRIMSGVQFKALERWLLKCKAESEYTPKFVLSPSVVTPFLRESQSPAGPRRYAVRSDGWDGFPASLRRLFAFIAGEKIRNVVFLCGDPHLSTMTRIGFSGAGLQDVAALCIVASPLYAPYPFANGKPREYLDDNRAAPLWLDEARTTSMHYSVIDGRFVEGDSFTIVDVARRAQGGWRVTASVYGRDGSKTDTAADLP